VSHHRGNGVGAEELTPLRLRNAFASDSLSGMSSIRRDCLDHFIIFNTRHLKRTLSSYFTYYHGSRTYLGLNKQCPHARSEGSLRFRISVACMTVMNALQCNTKPADAFSANATTASPRRA